MSTRYQRYKEEWQECTLCPLHKGRDKIVLGRGTFPSSVCFIGEAPGDSEDVLGSPFVGTSGKLFFKEIVPRAEEMCGPFSYAVNNLLACAPWEDKYARSVRPPAKEEVETCAPRLKEFLSMCSPKLIVTLGQVTARWLPKIIPSELEKTYILKLPHPAEIARMKVRAQKSFLIHQCAVRLASAVTQLKLGVRDEV